MQVSQKAGHKTISLFWDDLTPETQKELEIELGGDNGNYDVFPIAEIEFTEE